MAATTGKRGQTGRRVRLVDVAARCGVSVATVSRALGTGQGVAPDLRARVVEAAQRLGYVLPSGIAGKTVILAASQAAMIDYARSQFTLHVLDGLTERAGALGLDVRTRAVAGPGDEAALWAEVRGDPGIAGVLYLTPDDGDVAGRAGALGKPLVLVNGEDPWMRLSSVAPCNRSAAALATEALVAAGHRDILFLDRKSTRLNSSHNVESMLSRMPSSA
jgi:DNA-binding LacI/PurR family transcriptional regulator